MRVMDVNYITKLYNISMVSSMFFWILQICVTNSLDYCKKVLGLLVNQVFLFNKEKRI